MNCSIEEANELFQRMENVDKPAKERKKRIKSEYDNTKNSADYYKGKAIEKLKRIVQESSTHSDFIQYIEANPQEFLEEERKEICDLLKKFRESEKEFEKWKNHNAEIN